MGILLARNTGIEPKPSTRSNINIAPLTDFVEFGCSLSRKEKQFNSPVGIELFITPLGSQGLHG